MRSFLCRESYWLYVELFDTIVLSKKRKRGLSPLPEFNIRYNMIVMEF